MRTLLIAGAAVLAILAGSAAGYRLGAGAWPDASLVFNPRAATQPAAESAASAQKQILYWKHPDGAAEFSPEPKKTEDGRDYVPVYEDQEPGFKETQAQAARKQGDRKIIYYRNPMGLPDVSPVPKKDWMGMDYIPVYEGEETSSGTVTVSLDRVQRSGVRTDVARKRVLFMPVRAPGIAKPDERSLRVISLRADGFIEVLYVNETGKHVKAGQPLFRVYSPQIVSAQVDYRTSITTPGQGSRSESGARQRLKNLDVPDSVVEALRSNHNPTMSIDWPSPVSGVVMEKKVVEGQMARAGEELFRLADLGSIWVIADVSEQDLGRVSLGAPTKITFRAYPGRTFEGRVGFVLHEVDAATRTGKVRIEVHNPEHLVKHEMYADVVIDAGADDRPVVAVPASAVIDSGNRQVVIVDRGEGRFEPRAVKLGARGDGFVEVREGIAEGEVVVVSANFLIDAESNLKAALQAFTADAPSVGAKP